MHIPSSFMEYYDCSISISSVPNCNSNNHCVQINDKLMNGKYTNLQLRTPSVLLEQIVSRKQGQMEHRHAYSLHIVYG